ncbi:MAG: ATP-binding protein [Bacteroidetes bacterium]|nr:ATP-binding protein [Bacteroidota bacterium]
MIAKNINPFPVSGYHGAELFCNREKEIKSLIRNIENGVNTTLISIRRMGKTGTILHLFEQLKHENEITCIYADLYASRNFKDFTENIALSIHNAIPENKSIGKQFMKVLKSLNPVLSFDSLTGSPELHFEYIQPKQYEYSLSALFKFLDMQKKTIVFAMDEFQQIATYPETNTEAVLRTLFQHLKNVRFIFSGSNKHLINEVFSSSKRPFFGSTQMLSLSNIPKKIYLSFIKSKFKLFKRNISDEALVFIADWTKLHTFYTQALCNRIFADKYHKIELEEVKQSCARILIENEASYYQFRNLLTPLQWQFLKAIAKEEKVFQPNSKNFIQKYQLGTQANAQRALASLLNKEMIYQGNEDSRSYYAVYDCFLSRWLQHK